MGDRVKTNTGNTLKTCAHFRVFLLDFMGIVEEVSRFKMGFYEELQEI